MVNVDQWLLKHKLKLNLGKTYIMAGNLFWQEIFFGGNKNLAGKMFLGGKTILAGNKILAGKTILPGFSALQLSLELLDSHDVGVRDGFLCSQRIIIVLKVCGFQWSKRLYIMYLK